MSERPSDALGWDSDYWREPDDAVPDPEASVFGSPRPAPESYPPTQPDPYSQPQQPGYGAAPGQRYVPAPPPSRQGYDTAPQTQRYPPQYQQSQQGYPSQYGQPQTQRYPSQHQQQTQGYPQQYERYQQPQHEGYPPQHRQPQHREPQHREPRSRPDPDRRRERDSRSGGGFPLGLGAFVGVVGLGCFLAALLVLPWFTLGGEDVGLSDLREGFTVAETDAAGLPGASPEEPSVGEGGVPTAGEVGEAVEDEARDAATEAAADTIDSGKSRYLEMYVDTLWVPVAVGVALAVLFSTVLAPKSMALGMLLGFRRMAGAVTVLAAGAHGAALWVVFTGDSADDPAFGVWLGLAGLAAVFVAGIIGPKRAN